MARLKVGVDDVVYGYVTVFRYLEYLIFYTDQPDQPDGKWTLDGVQGDHLSNSITNLLPKTVYYFKIQARNSKGYGPFSPVLQYLAGRFNLAKLHNHKF
jgi:hypothetical protein